MTYLRSRPRQHAPAVGWRIMINSWVAGLCLVVASGCAGAELPSSGRSPTPGSSASTAPGDSKGGVPRSPSPSVRSDHSPNAGPGGRGRSAGGPDHKSSETPAKKRVNVIDWILRLGVDAPAGPDYGKFGLYQSLSRQDCQTPADPSKFPVLAAALTACRAAQAGSDARPEWWEAAAMVRAATQPSRLDCMDAMAFSVLAALVDAHSSHPDLPFRLSTSSTRGQPACLLIGGRDPDHGYPGDIITVTGTGLHRARSVTLLGSSRHSIRAPIVYRSATRLRFRIPRDLDDTGYNFVITWLNRNGTWTATGPVRFGPEPEPEPGPAETSDAPETSQEPVPQPSATPVPSGSGG